MAQEEKLTGAKSPLWQDCEGLSKSLPFSLYFTHPPFMRAIALK